MSTPILTNLDAVFRYSSFIHTYHPLGSSHVNLLGCLPCQLWRRKEGKVLKSVWQMTLLMDRCAQTPPEYQSSQLFSASTTKKGTKKTIFCQWTCGIGMLLVPVCKYDYEMTFLKSIRFVWITQKCLMRTTTMTGMMTNEGINGPSRANVVNFGQIHYWAH